uniref:SAP domain-containing protein n=1 Tax=Hucho hucho TaxID=62062 RepID=A0A4W5LLG1_9TELE
MAAPLNFISIYTVSHESRHAAYSQSSVVLLRLPVKRNTALDILFPLLPDTNKMADVVEIHKLKLAELKQECAVRGLEVKGNKGDLIGRLQAYLEEHGMVDLTFLH